MTSWTFFFFFVPFLAFVLLAVNFVFAPHNPYLEKNNVFECGFTSFFGQNRTQFSISFFIFALLFLLFDLEILLVYPYLVSSYNNETYGLVILLIFLMALTLGFVFELGKKALTIDSRQTMENKPVGTQTNLSIFLFGSIIKWVISWLKYRTFILFCDLLRKLYIWAAKRVVIYLYRKLGIETCVKYIVNWVFSSYKNFVIVSALLALLLSVLFICISFAIYKYGDDKIYYAAVRVVIFIIISLYLKITYPDLYNLVKPIIQVIIFNDICYILHSWALVLMLGNNKVTKKSSNNKGESGRKDPKKPNGDSIPYHDSDDEDDNFDHNNYDQDNDNNDDDKAAHRQKLDKRKEKRLAFLDTASPEEVNTHYTKERKWYKNYQKNQSPIERRRRLDKVRQRVNDMSPEQYEKHLWEKRVSSMQDRSRETPEATRKRLDQNKQYRDSLPEEVVKARRDIKNARRREKRAREKANS